jgi:hypothetical protein
MYNDYFVQVNLQYGDLGVIGRLMVPGNIVSLAVDDNMNILGLESPADGPSRLIAIHRTNGLGTPVRTFGTSHLRGIAFDPRVPTLAVLGQELQSLPKHFTLEQNYPNPFNPETAIRYELPVTSSVKLIIYDLLGREVEMLVNEHKSAGIHSTTWNASRMASGVYFCRLAAGRFIQTRRMLLLR